MSIRLLLVGDVMMGRSVSRDPVCDAIKAAFQEADVVAGNLETTITTAETAREHRDETRAFNFRMPPKHGAWLLDFNFLARGNNHALDYGAKGLVETSLFLDALGIAHTGAGMTAERAQRPAFLDVKGKRIGFLSAADHFKEWRAAGDRAGIHYFRPSDDDDALVARVRATKKEADLLVVYVHWGPNWVAEVPGWMRAYGERLVLEGGANVVVGTSAHHRLGAEVVGDGRGIVVYGTGDFVNDYAVNTDYASDEGSIVQLDWDTAQRELVVTHLKTRIANGRVCL